MRTRKDIELLEEHYLANYAAKSKDSAGREHPEPDHDNRTCYQRDRDRIVHAEAFRKLEYKTQVFVIFEGDYYRTRLTHTIEVAQLARTIGRNLSLNEDLIEAIALAHDLGHPPFGHAGEDAINEMVTEGNPKGFNHNLRSFEIVTKFEKKYPNFPGLNLTREVLVGILKHQTIYDTPGGKIYRQYKEGPTLEAQVVDIADSLAYLNHDVDDGLTSGCISEQDLMESVLWQKAMARIIKVPGNGDNQMLRYQIVKELIDMQVKDLLMTTAKRLKEFNFNSSDDVKKHHDYIVAFSSIMQSERDQLQQLLNTKLYHHWRVERMTFKAKRILKDLFKVYLDNPKQLPYSIYPRDIKFSSEQKYELIGNYIASMTDRFAIDEHKRLFDPYPEGLIPMTQTASKKYRLILSAVHMVYRLVNSTYSVSELTLRLTRLLCQFIRASSAHIYLLDEDKKKITLIASFDNQINVLLDKPKQLTVISDDVMRVCRGAAIFENNRIALPLIADDYLGAIFIHRNTGDAVFSDFEREMLSVFAEQAVTAIKNLQLHAQHEKIILGSIESIGNLLKHQQHFGVNHAPAYVLIAQQLAERLKISSDGIKLLEYAAQLHDIGVIDIPFDILSKREALTAQEFKIIRHHTKRSVALIKSVAFLKPVLPIILYHHEKYDGTGYPSGLKKEQIPLGARIIAVVDAFEAMVQGRPYRAPLSIKLALEELVRYRGTQFDPHVVDAFIFLSNQKKFRKHLSLLKR